VPSRAEHRRRIARSVGPITSSSGITQCAGQQFMREPHKGGALAANPAYDCDQDRYHPGESR
jgi:hypothetical protein